MCECDVFLSFCNNHLGLLDERADHQECHTDIEINDFKETVEYNCNENEVIVGFESYHWNSREDRRWSVKCCKVKAPITQGRVGNEGASKCDEIFICSSCNSLQNASHVEGP